MLSLPIKIIIVEDEIVQANTLKRIFQTRFQDIEVCACSATVLDALSDINSHKPDVVILDLQLPDGTGFDVLNMLQRRDFELIVITGQRQFLHKTADFGTHNCLLKPYSSAELYAAIMRTAMNIQNRRYARAYQDLRHSMNDVIVVRSALHKESSLKTHDILYCKADKDWTYFYCSSSDVPIQSDKRLGEWENVLPKTAFMRVHKSYIVNLHHVGSWKHNHAKAIAILTNKAEIPISRYHKTEFIIQFEN